MISKLLAFLIHLLLSYSYLTDNFWGVNVLKLKDFLDAKDKTLKFQGPFVWTFKKL